MMMRDRLIPEPVIPDHEVLRKIGGGSYGDVWLARGVTGAMRAVKVVRRENFEDEIGFEREFEGILKYEPMSRGHAGLVNILHVGRSEKEGEFYYYVMELGDDIRTGNQINAVEYEPRNLRTDMEKASGAPLDSDFVMDVGLCLSEALAHLHDKGLAHRDIKPSNIIFVDGKAKLADIGLVAAKGQRTFVGTEGFVPPEGPGSTQADVYGLGKVLYEMATGKDRLQFPELPDELPETTNRKVWLSLNQIICDICEPRVSKRTIKTASGLASSLHRLQEGKKVKRKSGRALLLLVPMLLCVIAVGWIFREQFLPPEKQQMTQSDPPVKKEVEYGFVKVISDPEGAEVYDKEGNLIDITPFKKIQMVAGTPYWFEFRLDGYRTDIQEGVVVANETEIVENIMAIYAPPVVGQEWVDNMGISYQPIDDYHISAGYIRASHWRRFERATKKKTKAETITHSESGVKRRIVLVTPEQADEYCRWQTERALSEGYLNTEQYMTPQAEHSFSSLEMSAGAKKKGLKPFYSLVKNISYAYLEIVTEPEGAICQINGEYKGITPRDRVRVKPGNIELSITLEGYRRVIKQIYLDDGVAHKVEVNLKQDNSVVFGEKWENALGMQFVPIDEDLLVSVWETRVVDYATYVKEAEVKKPASPGFRQGPNHPVLQVSRDDAVAFCKWLTTRERRNERIPADVEYRLLTDLEWSLLAGLIEDPDHLPTAREFRSEKMFPWGIVWPPEDVGFKVGNLADRAASKSVNVKRDRTLLNYNDGFEKTSPVGSFPSNNLGIYDLAGNAHEWVADDYKGQGKYGVLRGGGWNSYQKEHLYVTQRNAVRPSKASNLYGFRVALAKTSAARTLDFLEEDTLVNE